jgi:NAD(P)-dependent dehydrogenase (short-subunit alcohol dehydrogenase family)
VFQGGDASDAGVARATVERAESEFGGLHLVFDNAGIGDSGTTGEISLEACRRVIDVNMHGVFHGMRLRIPAMLASGAARSSTTPPSWAWWERRRRPRKSPPSTG